MNKFRSLLHGLRVYLGANISYFFQKQVNSPLMITYFITQRCNFRCIMCDDWKTPRNPNELTTDEVFKLLDDAKKMGVFIFNISGGEPLLRKDIIPIIRYAHELDFKVKLNTNGSLITREIAADLVENLDYLTFSLDGSTSDANNRVRRNQYGFERVMKGIELVAKEKEKQRRDIRIIGAFTIFKDNYRDMPSVVGLVDRLPLSHIGFNTINSWRVCNAAKRNSLLPTKEELSPVINEILLMKKKYSPIRNSNFYLKNVLEYVENPLIYPLPCKILHIVTYISPEGYVQPCLSMPEVIGNLRESSLNEIWHSQAYSNMRNHVKTGACPKCWWSCTAELNILFSQKHAIGGLIESIKNIL